MNKKKTSAVTNGKPIRDPSKPKSEGVELQELRLRIPGQAGHRFQTKVDTDSGASWTAIPREGGH